MGPRAKVAQNVYENSRCSDFIDSFYEHKMMLENDDLIDHLTIEDTHSLKL